MYNLASSPEYATHYLSWPETTPRLCEKCGSPIKYAHSGNGKIIHTLEGKIHQVLHYYTCTSELCPFSSKYFNPSPRYDYCKSHFGQDVLDRVSREIFIFEQTPQQIHKRLTLDFNLEISLRTIQRMYKDLLVAKAHQIDENTKEIISSQSKIILALDGQDPGEGYPAVWAFTDLISNRLLRTIIRNTMPSEVINKEIQQILSEYAVNLVGVVSDKQNNIVKCMNTHYPTVPHQYCTLHFVSHLWNHLEMFDSRLYSHLNSVIRQLTILKGNPHQLTHYEGIGKKNHQEIFKSMKEDLFKMTKIRSKKFQFLKGLWLYRTLKSYMEGMGELVLVIGTSLRIEKTFRKVYGILQNLIHENRKWFFQTLFLYDGFKLVYQRIYSPIPLKTEKQIQLDNIFGRFWALVVIQRPEKQIEELRAFLPKATSKFSDILSEWVRLWNSYLPGLFAYYKFPKWTPTNTAEERAFGIEKSKIMKRLSKKNIGFFLQTRAELYLRLVYATKEEIERKCIDLFLNDMIDSLRQELQEKISKQTKLWTIKSIKYEGYRKTLKDYHPKWRIIMLKHKKKIA